MTLKRIRRSFLPLLAVAGLSACAGSGVQPGIIHTAAGSGPGYGNAAGPSHGTATGPAYGAATIPAYGAATVPAYASAAPGTPASAGDVGRIVSIRDIEMRGGSTSSSSSRGGVGNGMLLGGVVGGLGGAVIGSSIGGRGGGGGLVGLLLGAVGGAVAGAIVDKQGGGLGGMSVGRGIEVVVQKDNGQSVTIAQPDDGDVQLGDRVQVVTDRSGVAKAVRDNSRPLD